MNEVILELEDHYFAAMIIKTGSDRTHQCMLGGNFDEDQDICIILKCFPRDSLLIVKVWGGKQYLYNGEFGQHLDQVININITGENRHDTLKDIISHMQYSGLEYITSIKSQGDTKQT